MSFEILDDETAVKLHEYLLENTRRGTFFWQAGHVCTLKDNTRLVLRRDMVLRHRRDGRPGKRFEWLKNKPYCEPGTTGDIYLSKATLTDTRVKPAGYNGRTRLAKIQSHPEGIRWYYATAEHAHASRSGHLHTSFPTMILDEEASRYQLTVHSADKYWVGHNEILVRVLQDGRISCKLKNKKGIDWVYVLPDDITSQKPLTSEDLLAQRNTILQGLARIDAIPCTSMLFMHRMPGKRLEDILEEDKKGPLLPLETRLRLTLETVRTIRRQTVDSEVIHRDLKPANIIVDLTDGIRVNLVDYAYGRAADKTDDVLPGTPAYAAPEVINGDTNHTAAIDVFSTVRTLLRLWRCNEDYYTSGYAGTDFLNSNPAVLNTLFTGINDLPETIASLLKQLFADMLQADPIKRPSLDVVETALEKILELWLPKNTDSPTPQCSSSTAAASSSGLPASTPAPVSAPAPASSPGSDSDTLRYSSATNDCSGSGLPVCSSSTDSHSVESSLTNVDFEPPFGPVDLGEKRRRLLKNIYEGAEAMVAQCHGNACLLNSVNTISQTASRLLDLSFADYLNEAPTCRQTMETFLGNLQQKKTRRHWAFFCLPFLVGTADATTDNWATHVQALQRAVFALNRHDADCWGDILSDDTEPTLTVVTP